MAEGDDALGVILYLTTIFTGLIGIITIAPLVAELYLFHVLDRLDANVTDKAVLAGFSAINGLLAVTVHSGDPNIDPILPTVITALTFLFLAIKLESGAGYEVRGS
ncbi:hypothetical protein CL1_0330 [Thermococcus cleftensis]|uniref:Uncharacterized protein n=1 Tax=Thermococcus cleftensis (strain DSM 27260 / KACC 17922 / CL1) TaxID=163003 RepID=I3ZS57_THECF|nr:MULTISPECIES: hypothetical protein [Thermococcus]AFL94541.1 hypothetical protein CL1_0330 [Thermococcus cleftensis]NJE03114.1 hypothetical protein [Thermococcus sp. MV11]